MNDILKTESAYTGKNVNIVFFRLQTQRNKYFKMSYSSAAKYIPYMSISEFSFLQDSTVSSTASRMSKR